MGDSEEEYERQRRDKFQRERSDQFERRSRDSRDWNQRDRSRGSWGGNNTGSDMKSGDMRQIPDHRRRTVHGYSGHGGGNPHHSDMKRRYSPDHNDDMRGRKRIRHFEGGFEQGGWGGGWPDARMMHDRPMHDRPLPPPSEPDKGPRMMTFKQWLNTQPDEITDEEAVTNYTEYKVNFRRQQLQTFFMDHKNEEWFKEKYHPDEADKRYVDQCASIHWRADIFKKLVEYDTFQAVDLDLDNENEIIKVLDSAVILMEGGNKDDLAILSMDEEAIENELLESKRAKENSVATLKGIDSAADVNDQVGKPMQPEVLTEEQFELKKQAALYKQLVDKKTDGDDEDKTNGGDEIKAIKTEPEPSHDHPKEENQQETTNTEEPNEKKIDEDGELPPEKKPRALHRTHSIFMRNLPPSVTKQEIVNLCKRFPGFIRVAFSNPLLEDRTRNYYRRCWVTFDRSVNIKDICWNLNNLRLRDIELNPVVNRDLARRVRPVSGISSHASCARADLKNIARLIMHLDAKWKLWEDKSNAEKSSEEKSDESRNGGGGEQSSKNPYLTDLSQYLVDESNAEEEELLGAEEQEKEEGEAPPGEQNPIIKITRDQKLIKVLDRLLYYLRIVHSIDYYNALEYPCEDEMPNRCGIVHARGPVPPNMLTKEDISQFQKRFNDKLSSILNFKDKLTDEEAKKLGPKDSETEVEKFIQANSQEIGKDKWLCPLSGKKFKGPDYIRKHIFNKHADKLEAVKKEVQYFNNYLMDPRRPTPLDGQVNTAKPPPPPSPMQMGGRPPFPPPPGTPIFRGDPGRVGYSTPQFHQRPPPPYATNPGRTFPPKRDIRPGGDPYASRSIVGYQDLDAPEETDFF